MQRLVRGEGPGSISDPLHSSRCTLQGDTASKNISNSNSSPAEGPGGADRHREEKSGPKAADPFLLASIHADKMLRDLELENAAYQEALRQAAVGCFAVTVTVPISLRLGVGRGTRVGGTCIRALAFSPCKSLAQRVPQIG